MTTQWADYGAARGDLTANTGAGLGVMLNDPEEEHSCFADDTKNDHYYDGPGVQNVYYCEYIGAEMNGTAAVSVQLPMVASVNALTQDVPSSKYQRCHLTLRMLGTTTWSKSPRFRLRCTRTPSDISPSECSGKEMAQWMVSSAFTRSDHQ